MPEKFIFADSEAGMTLAFNLTLSLRASGFKTRMMPEVVGHTLVHVLTATPPFRPNRQARGCDVRG